MDLAKAVRDPWVWGQIALIAVVGLVAPLLPRHVSLGGLDPVINRVDPDGIRWLGAPLIAAGLVIALWGVRSLGRSLTPGTASMARTSSATTSGRRPSLTLGIDSIMAMARL